MKSIDIDEIKNIKTELEDLEDEILYITENNQNKYVVLPVKLIEEAQSAFNVFDNTNDLSKNTQIRVINANNFELTYDEYESVKEQIMDAFEKTFKPKPEKLN